MLVPRSTITYPGWMAGPLHSLIPLPSHNPKTVGIAYTIVLVLMFVAYAVVLGAAHTLSVRMVLVAIGVLELILLMSPPLQLNDVFNYLGYARLGALHHLNPYTHVIKQEFFDPVYRFSSWHNLRSPYGSLFSAITYPLACSRCRSPTGSSSWSRSRSASAFSRSSGAARSRWAATRASCSCSSPSTRSSCSTRSAAFTMTSSCSCPRWARSACCWPGATAAAGAAIVIAIAVKFTAVLLLPFLLVAAATRPRQIRVVTGAALAAVPMIALSLAMFGLSLPNLVDQSALLTDFSIPNLVGLLIGVGGGTPVLLKLADVAVVLVIGFQFFRRRDWMSGAAWSTFALLASLAWLVPWYVVWLLPLAALAGSVSLRRVAIGMTAFLIFAFMPGTGLYFSSHGINLLGSSVGQASRSHQNKLAQ